jgi:hypothetical protein
MNLWTKHLVLLTALPVLDSNRVDLRHAAVLWLEPIICPSNENAIDAKRRQEPVSSLRACRQSLSIAGLVTELRLTPTSEGAGRNKRGHVVPEDTG